MSNDVMGLLRSAMSALIERGDVDLVPDPDDPTGDAFEIQADDWTLFVKGSPVSRAWIAVDADAEGTSATSLRHELEDALTSDDADGMLALDDLMDGSLIRALTASHDPLSEELARLLEECRETP